jgi:hypothetical protein
MAPSWGRCRPAAPAGEAVAARGSHAETCRLRAFRGLADGALRNGGPSTGGWIGGAALHPGAMRRIPPRRLEMAGLTPEGVRPVERTRAACAIRAASRSSHHARLCAPCRPGKGKPSRDAQSLTLSIRTPWDDAPVVAIPERIAPGPKRSGRRRPSRIFRRSRICLALASSDDRWAGRGRGRSRGSGAP